MECRMEKVKCYNHTIEETGKLPGVLGIMESRRTIPLDEKRSISATRRAEASKDARRGVSIIEG